MRDRTGIPHLSYTGHLFCSTSRDHPASRQRILRTVRSTTRGSGYAQVHAKAVETKVPVGESGASRQVWCSEGDPTGKRKFYQSRLTTMHSTVHSTTLTA